MMLEKFNPSVIHYDDYFPFDVHIGDIYAYPQHKTTMHVHDEVEFLYVREGRMIVNVNGDEVILEKDEGFFINCHVIHYSCSIQNEHNQFVLIQIHPDFLAGVNAMQEFISPVCDNKNLPYILLRPHIPWQKRMLNCINDIAKISNHVLAPVKILTYFSEIWTLILENALERREDFDPDEDSIRMRDMIDYIQNNYRKNLTLEEIAQSGYVSVSKCCKLFTEKFQISPMNYVKSYRLDQSAFLLKKTAKPITEIAMLTGFNDTAYFAKCFKEWSGLQPSAYRKYAKKIQGEKN